MIKIEVEDLCAVISRAAELKEGKDGETFLSFQVKLPVKGRDGSKADMEIGVSLNGDKGLKAVYTKGRRIHCKGVINVRKRKGVTYFNLRADGNVEIAPSGDEDNLTGIMEFRGKIGKNGVDSKTGKSGKPFKAFSAFSSEKDGDSTEFTWVRFLYFEPKDGEDFLDKERYVTIHGDARFSAFKDAVSMECIVSDAAPWELSKESKE